LLGFAYFLSSDSDPKNPNKYKKAARWALVVAGLSLIACGVYLYSQKVIPVTGFDSDLTFQTFIHSATHHTGTPQEYLDFVVSYDPSKMINHEQRVAYFESVPLRSLNYFSQLTPQQQHIWINTDGKGSRLLSILDLYSQSPLVGDNRATVDRVTDRIMNNLSAY